MREASDSWTATSEESHACFLYEFLSPGRGPPGMTKPKDVKIGERIRIVFDQMPKTCSIGWFAKELNCDRRNIYRIFKKENIDIQLLARISQILDHDFFHDLSEEK